MCSHVASICHVQRHSIEKFLEATQFRAAGGHLDFAVADSLRRSAELSASLGAATPLVVCSGIIIWGAKSGSPFSVGDCWLPSSSSNSSPSTSSAAQHRATHQPQACKFHG